MLIPLIAVLVGLSCGVWLLRRSIPSAFSGVQRFLPKGHSGEWLPAWIIAGAVLLAAGYIFYKHPVPALLLSLLAPLYGPAYRQRLRRRRDGKRLLQFKQVLTALSASLSAGKSLENALRDSVRELTLAEGENAELAGELQEVLNRLGYGESFERAFASFAVRLGMEDISRFADVVAITRSRGGDLPGVVRRAAEVIAEKIELEQDIAVVVARKRLESNLLAVLPFLIIGCLTWFSPEYMEPLYEGAGRLVMTLGLVVLAGACVTISKIMDIRV